MRILVVEDNKDLAASIVDYLDIQGHTCDLAFNGEAGLLAASQQSFDMYIFDISMPKLDGLALCRTLRQKQGDNTPVLFLTARDRLEDKIEGFSVGADDYLIKPFDFSELEARITAIYKRANNTLGSSLVVEDLCVDVNAEVVTRANQVIKLSPNNYKLLVVLMQRSPNVVLREELEYLVWGEELPDSDSLRSHIYKLRNKIDKPFLKPLIHTVKGRGFSLS